MKIKSAAAFVHTAKYYDLIYAYRDIPTQSKIIQKLLRSQLPKLKPLRILDVGCGTGEQSIALAQKGEMVTGLDKSKEMLVIARDKAVSARIAVDFIQADITSWIPHAKFDAVVSLFDVASYMTTNKQLDAFFSVATDSLTLGGIFLFDAWWGPSVVRVPPKKTIQEYQAGTTKIKRLKTPHINTNANTVSVAHSLTIWDKGKHAKLPDEIHVMRYYFYPEIEYVAMQWGFKIINWGELTYPIQPISKNSWSAAFLLKKIK